MAKNLSRKVTIYIDGKPAEASIQQLNAQMNHLINVQKKLPIGTQEYIDKTKEIARIRQILHDQSVAANDLGNSWKSATDKIAQYSTFIMGIQSLFQMADVGIGKLKDLVADAAELDDAYADVMKTTGLTRDEVLKLNESFKKMDTRTAREQLNQLAYEAGKLGINSPQQVEQFVRAADKINIALGDVLGEGAMVTIGKLADVYSKSTAQLTAAGDDLEKKMLSIGSAVNQLGQSSTANEGYLVEFLSRMGGIATQANLSADAILGFASALDQDMMKQEMSATAFQKFIMQLIKKPAEFAAAAHMEVKEFTDLMQRDMNEALLRVLEGFKGQGGLVSLQPIFEDLGLDAARAASVISSMANSIDQIREAQAIANDELTTGSSIIREFTTKNNTMQAQAEKAKKAFQDMRLELGEQLYPVVIHLTRLSTSAIKGLSGYLTLWKENRAAAVALTTATATLVTWLARHRLATLGLTAANIKRKAAAALEAAGNRILNATIKAGTVATKTATVAKQQASLVSLRLQKAHIALAASNKTVSYTIDGIKYSSDRLTAARNLDIAITRQQATANKTLAASFMAVPWGWVIAIVTTAATAISGLYNNSKKVKQEKFLDDVARQAGVAQGRLNYLFDTLRRTTAGSKQYSQALEELRSQYPDLIAQHIDEEGKLRNLEAAYKDLSNAARQSVYDRMFADKVAESQGELAKKEQDTMKTIGKHIDRLAKNLSDAERTVIKQRFNALVVEAAESETSIIDIMSRLHDEFNRAGIERHTMGASIIVEELMRMRGAANLAKKALEDLRVEMGASVNDPFGLQGKNLSQLNAELETAQRRLQSFQRALDQGREGFQAKIDTETARIKAIKQAIASIPSTQSIESTQSTSTIPDPKQAEKDLKKWQQVKEQAERLISDFSAKAQSGLSRTLAEIENRSASLRRDIEESVGATRQQKDALIAQVNEAEDAYKRAKIDEYIKKLTTEAAKLGDTGSQPVDRVRQAAARLAQQLAEIDNQINAINDDLQSKDISDSQRQQLEALIQQYAAAKQQLSASAFRGIDTAVDTSSFSLSGDAAKDARAYATLTGQIRNARQATEELRNLATDPALRNEYEAQLTDLEEQQRTLDEIYSGAEQFADKVRKGKLLDNLISSLQFFGDQALDILGNIFQIVNNIGQRELREAEQLKDRNIANLDDQLAQGLISQEQYDNRKTKLEEDYQAKQKEIELEAWRREKLLNSSQAAMAGALAILRVWSDAGNGPTAMRAVQTAIVGAATLAQIAAIADEPEPYARGGYVRDKKIMVGEAGSEWIASHRLLSDPVTAPVIAALDSYQRLPAMAAVNMPAVNQVSQQRNESSRINAALLAEMRRLADYLSDPANRRAVISRRTQETFDANENFLRNAARL